MLIKQDKDIESLSWLGEGALTVLSSLILATVKREERSSFTYTEIKRQRKGCYHYLYDSFSNNRE